MQPKIRGCQSQNARLVHLLGSIGHCWYQLGKTVDVSIHLVPTMFFHHVAGLPAVTKRDNELLGFTPTTHKLNQPSSPGKLSTCGSNLSLIVDVTLPTPNAGRHKKEQMKQQIRCFGRCQEHLRWHYWDQE